jgi:hypothetical protein
MRGSRKWTPPSRTMAFRLTTGFGHGKRFSHRRSKFPSAGLARGGVIHKRVRKLQSNQVVTLGMGDPERSSADRAGSFGKARRGCQRRTGDFERNLRRERERPTHRNQRSSSRNVQGGGKLEELFSLFIPATDEYWDCQWQTWPLAALCFRLASVQSIPLDTSVRPESPHLGGQTTHPIWETSHERPANKGRFRENYRSTAAIVYGYFRFYFPHESRLPPVLNGLQLQAFSSP